MIYSIYGAGVAGGTGYHRLLYGAPARIRGRVLYVLVKEVDRPLDGKLGVLPEIVTVAAVGLELGLLACRLDSFIEGFGELGWDRLIGRAMMELDRPR